MNWIVFVLASWFAMGLELGLRDALRVGPVAPSFVIPFAAYIALSTPARAGVWACLFLGILLDLTWGVPRQGIGPATILGPYALGLLLAGQLVQALRGFVIRKNPLTLVFLSACASLVCHTIVTAFMTAHALFGDPIVWRASEELLQRAIGSIWTAVLALPLSLLLRPLEPLFGFQPVRAARRF